MKQWLTVFTVKGDTKVQLNGNQNNTVKFTASQDWSAGFVVLFKRRTVIELKTALYKHPFI